MDYIGMTKHINGELYHKMKSDACAKKGIKLLHVYEDDWHDKKDIVKSKLTYLLNKCKDKIYARKTKICAVSLKESKKFVEANCLDKYDDTSTHSLGLYVNSNKLIMLMTYAITTDKIEIKNCCSLHNICVVGGISKLCKHIVEELHIDKLQATVYNHLSNTNTVFDKLAFSEIAEYSPCVEVRQSEGSSYEVYNCGKHVYEIDNTISC